MKWSYYSWEHKEGRMKTLQRGSGTEVLVTVPSPHDDPLKGGYAYSLQQRTEQNVALNVPLSSLWKCLH